MAFRKKIKERALAFTGFDITLTDKIVINHSSQFDLLSHRVQENRLQSVVPFSK